MLPLLRSIFAIPRARRPPRPHALHQAYDLVAGRRSLVLSRYVAPTEALGLFPTLAQKQPDTGRQLKGAVSERAGGRAGEQSYDVYEIAPNPICVK